MTNLTLKRRKTDGHDTVHLDQSRTRSKNAGVAAIKQRRGRTSGAGTDAINLGSRVLLRSLSLVVRMTEPPFVSRERLQKHQQYFQRVPKHTYLKGRYDVITSVAIPLALAASSIFLIGRGVYNMSLGIGKKE
ncbi:uncharacterized protein [Elaeis guineensis]|uniref:Uncharacterized protein LOC105052182 isoform X2 n=1 Tax=Elaeis guineensis var. tenera TaxID=51953 RepID=A0A6I9RS37_ELAGV|nr:uncharacterized protein LOC105052182 isoform X2 [Elaeis guineensis]